MSDIVIKAENLGKKYIIGHEDANGRYTALRDVLMQNARGLWHKTRDLVQGKPIVQGDTLEEVWALKDVSFEIRRGEAVGIIGRNGAGKSTLLKILSRITEPSAGRITVKGRVASLLEVGTGFHYELTGRENIYLNGAILGMTRKEIKRKFDEIVAFAEVEQYLDTPVKRYSSGMYVRLAFAVSAHLEPEILVVDEVLAVGDAAFQKKCLGKMGDVAQGGRTVLFVSHNMATVSSLCSMAYLLEQGRLASCGLSQKVIDQYIRSLDKLTSSLLGDRRDRKGDGRLRFTKVTIVDANGGAPVDNVRSNDNIKLVLSYEIPDGKPKHNVSVSISFYGTFGEHLFTCSSRMLDSDYQTLPAKGQLICKLNRLPLSPGRYLFNVYCEINGVLADWVLEAGVLSVIEGDYFGTGRLPPATHGGFLVPHEWAMDIVGSF
jgi:lipopolysaccharide transport system ATP-binding protein